MMEAGADFIYLRKSNINNAYWYAYLEQFPYGFDNRFITTDFQLLHDLGLGGFHFQQDIVKSLTVEDLRENLALLRMKDKISSVTAHDLGELKKYDGVFDHILISPIFDSISKKGYSSAWDLEELKDYIFNRKDKRSLLFAQGGVDDQKLAIIQELGLDGLTLLGYLWEDASNALQNFEKLQLG